jgi:hypothetical protein
LTAGKTYYIEVVSRSVELTITRPEKQVTGIEVARLPDKTTFIANYDYFLQMLGGLQLNVLYSDGSKATYDYDGNLLFDGEEVDIRCPDIIGDQIAIIRYAGRTAAFAVRGLSWDEGFADAPIVVQGTPVTVEAGARRMYRFTPAVSGRYRIFSPGNTAAAGYRGTYFYEHTGAKLSGGSGFGSNDVIVAAVLEEG